MTQARHASLLLLASLVTAALSYVFFATTTRALGAVDAAPVTVLWTYWSFAGAALTFPLQHWITWSITAHGGEGQVRSGLVRILLLLAGLSLVVALLTWAVRDPLLRRDDLWFPVMLGLVTVGSGLTGIVRGALTGRGRYRALASSLVLENLVRVLGAVALSGAGIDSPVAFGFALVLGHATVAVFPGALLFSRGVAHRVAGSPIGFLSGTASGQLLAQTVLTGGPVLAAFLAAPPAAVTALFAALALFRAPYTLALGVVPKLTAELAGRITSSGGRDAVRHVNTWTAAGTLVLAGPVAVGAGWLGGPLLRLVFGDDVVLGRVPLALIALGCLVALSNLVSNVAAMAAGRAHRIPLVWVAAVGIAGAYCLVVDLAPTERTTSAFVVAELVALVGLLLLGRTSDVSRGVSP